MVEGVPESAPRYGGIFCASIIIFPKLDTILGKNKVEMLNCIKLIH